MPTLHASTSTYLAILAIVLIGVSIIQILKTLPIVIHAVATNPMVRFARRWWAYKSGHGVHKLGAPGVVPDNYLLPSQGWEGSYA
jgi:hypothetical protein